MAVTKIYTGAAFVEVRYKVYDGAAWIDVPKFWDGAAWIDLNSQLSVSPVANGRVNARVNATCFSGVTWNLNGIEYEITATGGVDAQGDWLDSGLNSEVWVQRFVTAGSWNSIDPGTGRFQLSTTRSWRVVRVSNGIQSVTGHFEMWDAASGGNMLAQTSSAVWSAQFIFDGCPECCFTPDTLIMLSSGMEKRIASIRPGDMILVVDEETGAQKAEAVTGIITRKDRRMYRAHFDHGLTLNFSEDHPLFVQGKGFASMNPRISEYKDMGFAAQLEVGDHIADQTGRGRLINRIDDITYNGTVYTLENKRFFANGLLVY